MMLSNKTKEVITRFARYDVGVTNKGTDGIELLESAIVQLRDLETFRELWKKRKLNQFTSSGPFNNKFLEEYGLCYNVLYHTLLTFDFP